MDYHLFKKAVKSKNKTVRRRYYYFIDQVYAEAPFHNLSYIPAPSFPKFKRNTIKKDIFSTAELNRLFDENVWRTLHKHMYEKLPQYDEGYKAIYLLFLTSVTCGLRLGEAIGVRVKQFLFEQKIFVVDGFYKYTERIRTDFNKCGTESRFENIFWKNGFAALYTFRGLKSAQEN